MNTAKHGIRALAALAALPATLAVAQLPPVVVITFDAAATSVPVGGISTWIAALALVALALWFGRRHSGTVRSVGLLLATGSVVTLSYLGSPTATAITSVPYAINLTSSPTSVTFGSAPEGSDNYRWQLNNTSGTQITLRGLTINNAGGISLGPDTTCAVGLVIAPGGSCLVQLQSTD